MFYKIETQNLYYSYLISMIVLLVSATLTACISEPSLKYPKPKQDFATYTDEPMLRYDARPSPELDLDLGLDMELDQEIVLDQELNQPTLQTQSLDFVGEEQSTYNGIEPRIVGRYLWVLPNPQASIKKTKANPHHTE